MIKSFVLLATLFTSAFGVGCSSTSSGGDAAAGTAGADTAGTGGQSASGGSAGANSVGGTSTGGTSGAAGASNVGGTGGATTGGTNGGGAAGTSTAGTSAGGSSTAGDLAVCYQMAKGTCVSQMSNASAKAILDSACTNNGGTTPATCPTASLLGCCTIPAAGQEQCSYTQASGPLTEMQCKQVGGTWSTTP